jgi:hypothetical protein
MLDRSYLTMRTEDVMASARFLAGYEAGQEPNRVHLMSIGLVGPAALHAAALEPQLFGSITLKSCLVSWSNAVRTPRARNQFASAVHGALRTYDLPDLAATLPSDKLTVSEPVDALGQPASN